MTDRQIIIDGVDVNGCEYFGTTLSSMKNCAMDSEYLHSCKGCNCYYKQLKAKEQECERLKYDNDYEVGALEKTIDNLRAELEQEKTLKEMYFTYYKAKHGDIKGEFFKLKAENEKLKMTLEELISEVENEN